MHEGQRQKDRGRSGWRTVVVVLASLAVAGSWGSPAAGQQAAYTVAGSELYRLDFATGDLTLLGDLGIAGIEALAVDPSGVLYGITPDDLYTIDPTVPAVALVGPTGLAGSLLLRSMTFDDGGRLWLVAAESLHEVDPATGAVTPIVLVIQGLLALAADGIDLFGIIAGIPPPPAGPPTGPFPPRVVSLEPDGTSQFLATLDGLVEEGPFDLDDMVFDDQGNAWLLAIDDIPVTPPQAFHRIYRAVEIETGVVELISERSEIDVSVLMSAMALLPNRGIVDIPTLGWGGLGMLVAALAGCALAVLRRRSR